MKYIPKVGHTIIHRNDKYIVKKVGNIIEYTYNDVKNMCPKNDWIEFVVGKKVTTDYIAQTLLNGII